MILYKSIVKYVDSYRVKRYKGQAVKMKKIAAITSIVLFVFLFAWFIYPTPYQTYTWGTESNLLIYKLNRFTNTIYLIGSGREPWTRTCKTTFGLITCQALDYDQLIGAIVAIGMEKNKFARKKYIDQFNNNIFPKYEKVWVARGRGMERDAYLKRINDLRIAGDKEKANILINFWNENPGVLSTEGTIKKDELVKLK